MAEKQDENEKQATPGGMVDHLRRYRDYIGGLKAGNASGISSAFGRASQILGIEAGQAAKEAAARNAAPAPEPAAPVEATAPTSAKICSAEVSAAVKVQKALQEAVTAPATMDSASQHADDPIGARVMTSGGEQEVLSVYVENGERMFMLSDLSVIDEKSFLATQIKPEVPRFAEIPAESPVEAASARRTDLHVTDANGASLWTVYWGETEPELIAMIDGSLIKQAEGEQKFVFSSVAPSGGEIRFFILDGLVVDPSTGNIYMEASGGEYCAAFLNNGWRIEQYQRPGRTQRFFVTEPRRSDRTAVTTEVADLQLDLATGEVTYQTADRAATMTLQSRIICPGY